MSIDSYWLIFAQEVPADLGIDLTDEQINKLARALEGAHENYSLATGRSIADQNWRAVHDQEMQVTGAKAVMDFFSSRLAEIDRGPSRIFDHMSHRQRLAMHEMFDAKTFLRQACILF